MGINNITEKVRQTAKNLPGHLRNIVIAISLALSSGNSNPVVAETITDHQTPKTEIVKKTSQIPTKEKAEATESIDVIGNLERETGIPFPREYRKPFQEFIDNNKILQNKKLWDFTIKYISEELHKFGEGLGVDERKKLDLPILQFFMVLESIRVWTGSYPEFEPSDGDYEKISDIPYDLDEFNENFDEACKKMIDEVNTNVKKGLNEYLGHLKEYYENYHSILSKYEEGSSDYKTRKNKMDKEVEDIKKDVQRLIHRCEKYGIDWKSIITPDMMEFYGIGYDFAQISNTEDNFGYYATDVRDYGSNPKVLEELLNELGTIISYYNDVSGANDSLRRIESLNGWAIASNKSHSYNDRNAA